MKKNSEPKRGFHQLSRAWYADAVMIKNSVYIDEINIGLYCPDGGTIGEFCIKWEMPGRKVTPKLVCYDDAWGALFKFQDLLKLMSEVDGKYINPNDFSAMLIKLGIEDMTQTKHKN